MANLNVCDKPKCSQIPSMIPTITTRHEIEHSISIDASQNGMGSNQTRRSSRCHSQPPVIDINSKNRSDCQNVSPASKASEHCEYDCIKSCDQNKIISTVTGPTKSHEHLLLPSIVLPIMLGDSDPSSGNNNEWSVTSTPLSKDLLSDQTTLKEPWHWHLLPILQWPARSRSEIHLFPSPCDSGGESGSEKGHSVPVTPGESPRDTPLSSPRILRKLTMDQPANPTHSGHTNSYFYLPSQEKSGIVPPANSTEALSTHAGRSTQILEAVAKDLLHPAQKEGAARRKPKPSHLREMNFWAPTSM